MADSIIKYMKERFHLYETLDKYREYKKNGLISPESLCFITETHQVFTQDSWYSISSKDFEVLKLLVQELQNNIKDIKEGTEGNTLDSLDKISQFLTGFSTDSTLNTIINGVLDEVKNNISELDKIERDINTLSADVKAEHNRAVLEENAIKEEVENLSNTTNSKINDTIIKLDKKVDKIDGKGLSTNDFTTAYKTKLESLENYDDTEIRNIINTHIENFNTLVNANPTEAIENFNEIIAFLDNIEDSEKLDSIIAGIETQIGNNKTNIDNLQSSVNNANTTNTTKFSEIDSTLENLGNAFTTTNNNLGETKTDIGRHISNHSNPHNVTKAQVGLGNVDNTSDLNKPISTATQTALNGKVDKEDGKVLSTNDYTTEEKTKLNEIEAGAQVNDISVVYEHNGMPLPNADISSVLGRLVTGGTGN